MKNNNYNPINPLNPFIGENYPHLLVWLKCLNCNRNNSSTVNPCENCNKCIPNVGELFDPKFLEDCELSSDGKEMVQDIIRLIEKFNTCPQDLTTEDFQSLLNYIYRQTLYLYTLDCKYLQIDDVCSAMDECERQRNMRWLPIGENYICEITSEPNWRPPVHPPGPASEWVRSVNNILPNLTGNVDIQINSIPQLRNELNYILYLISQTSGAQADWNETNEESPSFIKNKPDLFIGSGSSYIYVDKRSIGAIENGSFFYPYKSIQSAINNVDFGETIMIAPGEYSENIFMEKLENITLFAHSPIGQYRTVINGTVNMTDCNDIGINGIQINGGFTVDNSPSLYLTNVDVRGTGISLLGDNEYHNYVRVYFEGNLAAIASSGTIDLQDCQFENNAILNVSSSNITLACKDTRNLNVIHGAGNLYFYGSCNFIGFNSTCDLGNGALIFESGTFLGINGYIPLIKTGNCTYSLGKLIYEPLISAVNGTRIDDGLHSIQIFDHSARLGYTKINDYLSGHLDGISDEFLKQAEILNALQGLFIYRGRIDIPTSGITDAQLTARLQQLEGRDPQVGDVLTDSDNTDWYFNGSNWLNMGQSLINRASNDKSGIVQGNVDTSISDVSITNGFIKLNNESVSISNLTQEVINLISGGVEEITGSVYNNLIGTKRAFGSNLSDAPNVGTQINPIIFTYDIISDTNNSGSIIATQISPDNDINHGKIYSGVVITDTSGIPLIRWTDLTQGGSGTFEDNTNIIYVNGNYIGSEELGTIDKPYKTIPSAIDNLTQTKRIINVAPYTYFGNLSLNADNVTIIANGSIDNPTVRLNGELRINGINFTLHGFQADQFYSELSSNDSNITLSNCIFNDGMFIYGNSQTNGGTCKILKCKTESLGIVYFNNGSVYIDGCEGIRPNQYDNANISIDGNVYLNNTKEFYIIHNSGNLVIKDCYLGTDNSNMSLYSWVQNGNGTLTLISGTAIGFFRKSGNCPYSLGSFSFLMEPDSPLNTSNQILNGITSQQVFDSNVRTNYTPVNPSIKAHLDAINNKLGESSSFSDYTSIVWVNSNYTGNNELGLINEPYKTLDKALENNTSNCVIILSPGTYSSPMGMLYAINLNNVTITCLDDSLLDSKKVNFQSILAFSDCVNVTISNIRINSDLNIGDSNLNMINCYVSMSTNIYSSSSISKNLKFHNCTFNTITLNGSFISEFIECRENISGNSWQISGQKTTFTSCIGMCINHSQGILVIDGSTKLGINSLNNISLNCSTNTTSENLYLLSGTSLQDNGTLGIVYKNGTSDYFLGSFIGDFSGISAGNKIEKGLSDLQIYPEYIPINYIINSLELKEHLSGIDNALNNGGDGNFVKYIELTSGNIDELTENALYQVKNATVTGTFPTLNHIGFFILNLARDGIVSEQIATHGADNRVFYRGKAGDSYYPWSTLANLNDIPEYLPNPNHLSINFNGINQVSYDGSSQENLNIPLPVIYVQAQQPSSFKDGDIWIIP